MKRRRLIASTLALAALGTRAETPDMNDDRLVLTRFDDGELRVYDGMGWRGFSDRVMGGISNAELNKDEIASKECLRLTGNVTRESNGGFIQMALYLDGSGNGFDGSSYSGLELLLYGNDEDYNIHIRTADCGWYDESYRATINAKPEWQRIRIPWKDFKASGLSKPLDPSTLQRIAVLGWMREFKADVALAELALYR